MRTSNPARHGIPREAFGASEIEKMETPEITDNESNSAVIEWDGNPDRNPLVTAELF